MQGPLLLRSALLLLLMAVPPPAVQGAICSPGQYMLPGGTPANVAYNSTWTAVNNATADCKDPTVPGNGQNAWCAGPAARTGDWIQLDLQTTQFVASVFTMARAGAYSAQWVTNYSLSYSMDNMTWISIGSYMANTDSTTAVYNWPNVIARYLRLTVLGYNTYPSMRIMVQAYPNITCTPCPAGMFSASGAVAQCVSCPSGSVAIVSGQSACTPVTFLQTASSNTSSTLNAANGLLYYASSWGQGRACQSPRINGSACMPSTLPQTCSPTYALTPMVWCSASNAKGTEYLIMDAGATTTINGIQTMGNALANQWVKTYSVYFSNDTIAWSNQAYTNNYGKLMPAINFTANVDATSIVTTQIQATARYVKLLVTDYQGAGISMSASLLVSGPLNTNSSSSNGSMFFCFTPVPGNVPNPTTIPNCTNPIKPICKAGTFPNAPGSTVCLLCSPGYFSNAGDAACSPCAAGAFGSGYGASACAPCLNGSFSSAGATSCQRSCDAGMYLLNSAVCKWCPPGSFTSAANLATACTTCAPGSFMTDIGATACQLCPGGTFMPYAGASVPCAITPANSYSLQGASYYSPCTPFKSYSAAGASACLLCSTRSGAQSGLWLMSIPICTPFGDPCFCGLSEVCMKACSNTAPGFKIIFPPWNAQSCVCS